MLTKFNNARRDSTFQDLKRPITSNMPSIAAHYIERERYELHESNACGDKDCECPLQTCTLLSYWTFCNKRYQLRLELYLDYLQPPHDTTKFFVHFHHSWLGTTFLMSLPLQFQGTMLLGSKDGVGTTNTTWHLCRICWCETKVNHY